MKVASSHVQYAQTDTVQNYKLTIRTVWQIVKDSFRSVFSRKIVPHKWDIVIQAKGSQRFVDPYCLCGWQTLFSVCVRSKNCISLGDLEYIYHVLFERRGQNGLSIRTICTDRKTQFTVRKMHLIKRLKQNNISVKGYCHSKRRAR